MAIKVMIADEDLSFCNKCSEQLSSNAYEVVESASTGEKAIEHIKKHNPDIVLIHLWIPNGDAAYVISRIKKDPSCQTQFIVLSALNNTDMIKRVFECGAKSFMSKPFLYPNLFETIERLATEKNTKIDDACILSDMENEITKIIHQIGVPAHIKGYEYVRMAIFMSLQNKDIIHCVTKQLYPSVAAYFGTTPSRVERAIRHAIEVAWDRGDCDVLNKYFGYTILSTRGKPTNSEFIAMISDNLRMKKATAVLL